MEASETPPNFLANIKNNITFHGSREGKDWCQNLKGKVCKGCHSFHIPILFPYMSPEDMDGHRWALDSDYRLLKVR